MYNKCLGLFGFLLKLEKFIQKLLKNKMFIFIFYVFYKNFEQLVMKGVENSRIINVKYFIG